MSKYVTTQQYEPLRTPQGWSGDERRLIAQLTDIFDDIYRRFGRLRMEDLSSKTQAVINAKAESGDVERLEAELTLTAEGLSSKVSKGEVISAINQSAEEVAIEANKINLNGAVTANRYFKINTDGSMEAVSGKIGGFTVGEKSLTGAGANPIKLDAETGEFSVGGMTMYLEDGQTPMILSTSVGGDGVVLHPVISPGLVFLAELGNLSSVFAVFDEGQIRFNSPLVVEGRRVPKVMYGRGAVADGFADATINYADAGFETEPTIVATYTSTGNGDVGAINVYTKSVSSAVVSVPGSGFRSFDWIAVGV